MPRKFRDPMEIKQEQEQREKEHRERETRDRDDKPSWRERDAARNRSTHVEAPVQRESRRTDEMQRRGENLAKKALEDLFSGKKGKEQAEAWKHVCEATGSLFSRRATTYIEKYGIPRDWDDLLRLLDHSETQFVTTLLDRMLELAPDENESKRGLLIGKLRILKMTAEDPALVTKFEQSIESVSALS